MEMEKEISVGGRKIVYFEEGSGFPFLIIHGWALDPISYFFPFQKMLAGQGYRVILLTLPGFEKGESLSVCKTAKDYVDFILNFADELCIGKFSLIGHSMGGAIAIKLAAWHPERVQALILFSPGIMPFSEKHIWKHILFLMGFAGYMTVVKLTTFNVLLIFRLLKRLLLFFSGTKSGNTLKKIDCLITHWREYHYFFFKKGKITFAVFKNVVASGETADCLSKITSPALMVWGTKDFVYFLSRNFIKGITNHKVHIVAGVGHNIYQDNPEKAIELITDFIKQ